MAGTITSANNPNAIATIIAAKGLAFLKSQVVGFMVSDPQYGRELAQHGDTVNIPIPAVYTTNLLADGGTVSRQNPTLGNVSLVLNKHRETTWEHTDRNEAITRPDIQNLSLGQALANFSEECDADLLSIYSSFLGGNAVGAYNTAITEPAIDTAETNLFDQKAPQMDRKSLIVTGTGLSNIRQIPRFTEPTKAGPGASARSAKIMGTIKDFTVYRAQQVNVTSSTNRHGLAMTPTALLTAVRPLGTRGNGLGVRQVEVNMDGVGIRLTESYQHSILGHMTTIDLLYGFVCGRSVHGCEVKH